MHGGAHFVADLVRRDLVEPKHHKRGMWLCEAKSLMVLVVLARKNYEIHLAGSICPSMRDNSSCYRPQTYTTYGMAKDANSSMIKTKQRNACLSRYYSRLLTALP